VRAAVVGAGAPAMPAECHQQRGDVGRGAVGPRAGLQPEDRLAFLDRFGELDVGDGGGLYRGGVLGEDAAPSTEQALALQTERTRSLKLFGAPSFVVGSELFWGDDRLEEAIAWAADS